MGGKEFYRYGYGLSHQGEYFNGKLFKKFVFPSFHDFCKIVEMYRRIIIASEKTEIEYPREEDFKRLAYFLEMKEELVKEYIKHFNKLFKKTKNNRRKK